MNNKSNTQALSYMPQLDSLRAFAVILVIISHWFGENNFLNKYLPNGILGVTLFFVLSGYLITGILLQNKKLIGEGKLSVQKAFKKFYIRRALRIFPIYYLLIFVLLVFNIANIRQSFSWHFFYLSNFYFWIKGSFDGNLSHFWSLSVEEQFYLFWPAIIFFVSRPKLPLILITGIIAAMLFRFGIRNEPKQMGRFLLPGSLDSFCIGGLIAYGKSYQTSWFNKLYAYRNKAMILFFILFIAVQAFFHFVKQPVLFLVFYFAVISVIFGQLILLASYGIKKGPVAFILNSRLLINIGKISYGLYLFHNLIPFLYKLNIPFIPHPSFILIQAIRFLLLIALATLSWVLFERPILRLKKNI